MLSVIQETLNIGKTIGGEGGRCAEVCANWHSGAALNWREKRKKAGAIEGEKEGPWQQLRHTLG